MAEKLAELTDGMVLPPIWYGVASYAVGGPEKNTLNVNEDIMEDYLYAILQSLFLSGFKKNIYILIAHQTEDFMPMTLACMKAAKKLIMKTMQDENGYGWWGDKKNAGFYDNLVALDSPWNMIRVLLLPTERTSKELGSDHAGIYETSMLEYLQEGLVKFDRIGDSDDWFAKSAKEACVNLGKKMVDICIEDLLKVIKGE